MNFKHGVALTSLLVSLLASPSSADRPKHHPLYPQRDPVIAYDEQVTENSQAVVGHCKDVSPGQLEQSIYLNIPSFTLHLENRVGDELCSSYSFPVRVGRHWEKHFSKVNRSMETPVGEGVLVDKKWSGVFRYFDDVWKTKCVEYERQKGKSVCVSKRKVLVHRKDEIIRETSTFTDSGQPMTVPIEYPWMHSLGMKIYPAGKSDYTTRCVIHATTDSHTVGNAASHCCVGLRIDDMLKLYGLVSPEQQRGEISQQISLRTEYKVVERDGAALLLHADIYDRKEDYGALIGKELASVGETFDPVRVGVVVDTAKLQFDAAYKNVRRKLLQDRFITREEVAQLHYRVPIAELVQ